MKLLSNSLIEVLEQVKQLINSCNDKTYTASSLYTTSSIGQHVRHIIDHIIVFKSGISDGYIDYNIRSRGGLIETSLTQANEQLEKLIDWLANTNLKSESIQVISEVSVNQQKNIQVESNIEREVVYLINHTIHHIAYASLVAKQLDINVEQQLGLAPATVSYVSANN